MGVYIPEEDVNEARSISLMDFQSAVFELLGRDAGYYRNLKQSARDDFGPVMRDGSFPLPPTKLKKSEEVRKYPEPGAFF